MKQEIANRIKQSIEVKKDILTDEGVISAVDRTIAACINCYSSGGKIFFCGNGGSAADAQHLASELSGKFYLDRKPLFAEALHVNTSHLTAVANDYSYDQIYSRLIEAKGQKGDILFALSTSGKSENIIQAVDTANKLDLLTIGMIGQKNSVLSEKCSILISVPSEDTPRIQEGHMLLGHIICEMVELSLFA